MKKIHTVIATVVVIFAIFVISAFQAQTQKFGVCDLSSVANNSKYGKRKMQEIETARSKYFSILTFLRQNPFISRSEAQKFRDLSLSNSLTPAQQKDLDELKAGAQRLREEFERLVNMRNPSESEQRRIQELAVAREEIMQIQNTWGEEFARTLNDQFESAKEDVHNKVKAAVRKLGRRDGFSVIFDSNSAPYAANDVTDELLKVMDADNP